MTVFNACIKILKKNKTLLVIYFAIFTLMCFTMGNNAKENAESIFEAAEVKVSVINHDDSAYADSLIEYVKENARLVEIVESEEGIADGLFYRITEYVIEIPEGFGDAVKNGGDISLDKYQVSGSYSGIFMDNMVNKYVAKMQLYGPDVPEAEDTTVVMEGEETEENAAVYMYNFSAYALMAIIVLGIGTLLATFGKQDIRRRNRVSPVSDFKMGVSQIVCSMLFTLLVWLLISAISILVIGKDGIHSTEVYMMLNMLMFSFVCLAMGFCVGTVIKSENGRMIVANVISLGFSFIGGVMVPLEMLGNTVKTIGSFTPTYWFVKVNEMLVETTEYTSENLADIWRAIGIEGLFIVVFLAVGLAAVRKPSS